jgi:hypothetical protein
MDVLEPQQSPVRTLRPVFAFAAIVVVAFALFVSLFPLGAGRLLVKAQDWAALNVGWYYLLAMTLYLVFVVGVALSGTVASSSAPTMTSRSSATSPGPACCSPPASASPCSSSAFPNR